MQAKTARKLIRSVLAEDVEPDEAMVAKVAETLVKPVGPPGSVRWRAVRTVLAGNGELTEERVDAEQERRLAKLAVLKEKAKRLAEESADAAVAYVAAYRGTHGAGPTWAELAHEMGWPYAARNTIIRHLARTGRLQTTPEHRSLDVGAAARGAVTTDAGR
ncbi:hypothetical protein ACFV9C_42590 [Kribbella sp. NPDC059898]|uniref:hypothetical protein n=1 Tax=Kribbella sp. NPDC059898 TaxID=3346995 RepID=UPI003664449F